jgi:hypothetical protein
MFRYRRWIVADRSAADLIAAEDFAAVSPLESKLPERPESFPMVAVVRWKAEPLQVGFAKTAISGIR